MVGLTTGFSQGGDGPDNHHEHWEFILEAPDGFHNGCDILGGATVGIAGTYLLQNPIKKNILTSDLPRGNDLYVFSFMYTF